MSYSDFVSNGTCYYKANELADPSFVACGNDALGHVACCSENDMCLSDNACYNQTHGLTYLAGCTDSDYEDASCPDKPLLEDLPWVGLVYCENDLWAPCNQSAKPSTIDKPDHCTCPGVYVPAFTDASVLTNIARVPSTSGGDLEWQPGYVPKSTFFTLTPSGPTTETGSSPIAGANPPTSRPTTTTASGSNAQATESTGTGLGSAAWAGIGVGAAVGLVVLVAVLFALVRWKRLKNKDTEKKDVNADNNNNVDIKHDTKADDGDGDGDKAKLGAPVEANTDPTKDMARSPDPSKTPTTPAISELESTSARPWSVRSELDSHPEPSERAASSVFSHSEWAEQQRRRLEAVSEADEHGQTGAIFELPG